MEVTRELLDSGRIDVVPRWYGKAYANFIMNTVVFYPIPINLIVRWARDFYFLLRCYDLGYRERIEQQVFERGRQAGVDQIKQEYSNKLQLIRSGILK